MARFHWGPPRNVADLEFWNSSHGRDDLPFWQDNYTVHPVTGLYGLSWGDGRFLGLMTFGKRHREVRQGAPRTSSENNERNHSTNKGKDHDDHSR